MKFRIKAFEMFNVSRIFSSFVACFLKIHVYTLVNFEIQRFKHSKVKNTFVELFAIIRSIKHLSNVTI